MSQRSKQSGLKSGKYSVYRHDGRVDVNAQYYVFRLDNIAEKCRDQNLEPGQWPAELMAMNEYVACMQRAGYNKLAEDILKRIIEPAIAKVDQYFTASS